MLGTVDSLDKPHKHIDCEICGCSFRRKADCNRHTCSAERALLVRLQAGSRQCSRCGRWFRSAGGIAVRKCSMAMGQAASESSLSSSEPASVVVPRKSGLSCCSAHCSGCGRCCKSKRGFQLHRCAEAPSRPTASDRSSFQFVCGVRSRCFRRAGDLTRHQRFCPSSSSPLY